MPSMERLSQSDVRDKETVQGHMYINVDLIPNKAATSSCHSVREWRCSLEPQDRGSWQLKASIGHVVRFCLKKTKQRAGEMV